MRKEPKKKSVKAALLLAAGASSRMGEPKQLLEWRGGTLLEHTLQCLSEGGFDRIVLVLGAHLELFLERLPRLGGFLEAPAPLRALKTEAESAVERTGENEAACGTELLAVVNYNWAEGMASSLRRGLEAALARCAETDELLSAVGVCPVDLPLLNKEAVKSVLRSYAGCAEPEGTILVPECGGRRGHPVIFGSAYFKELSLLEGDRGGAAILKSHKESLILVSVNDAGIFEDCDDRDKYEELCGRVGIIE